MKKKNRNRRKRERARKEKMLLCEAAAAAGLQQEAMPVVDQCEPAQAGLATLSNTLEIFDKFKPVEDEKESDEESFHLPMLDDDESESKSTHSTGNKDGQNGETEEDILNKFDTAGHNSTTPDFDAKIEDSILDEGDDMVDNQMKSNINTILDNLDSPAERENSSQGNMVQCVRVNIEYKEIGGYEETAEDGEFMSMYEFESLDSQCNSVVSETQPECMEVQAKDTQLPLENVDEAQDHSESQCEEEQFDVQQDQCQEDIPEEQIEGPNKQEPLENLEAEKNNVAEVKEEQMWDKFIGNDSQDSAKGKQEPAEEFQAQSHDVVEDQVKNTVDKTTENTEGPEGVDCEGIKDEDVEPALENTSIQENSEFTENAVIPENNEFPDELLESTEEVINEIDKEDIEGDIVEPSNEFQDDDVEMAPLDDVEMAPESDAPPQESAEFTENYDATNGENNEVMNDLQNEDVEMQMEEDVNFEHEKEDENIDEPLEDAEEGVQSTAGLEEALEGNEQDNEISVDMETEEPINVPTEIEDEVEPDKCQEDVPSDVPLEEPDTVTEEASGISEKSDVENDIPPEEVEEVTDHPVGEDYVAPEELNEEASTTAEEKNMASDEANMPTAEASVAIKEIKENTEQEQEPEEIPLDNEDEALDIKDEDEIVGETGEDEQNKDIEESLEPTEEELIQEQQNEETTLDTTSKISLEDDPLLKELEETIKTPEPPQESPEVMADASKQSENDAKNEKSDEEKEKEVPKDPPPDDTVEPKEKLELKPLIDKEPSDSIAVDDETDLLDISIVRDTEEDDACAIQTAIEDNNAMIENDAEETTDVPTSDKSDDDQPEPSETLDQEADDSNDDKDDNGIDFDDVSNDCAPPESVQSSDIENKEDSSSDKVISETNKDGDVCNVSLDVDMDDVGTEKDKTEVSEKEDSAVTDKQQAFVEKSVENDVGVSEDSMADDADSRQSQDIVALDEESEATTDKELPDDVRSKSSKRSLDATEEDSSDVGAKKLKLSVPENEKEPTPPPSTEAANVTILSSFFKFMQSKKLKHRLTRSDLEQFCLQKLGEIMWHKTTEGELHQTIAKQGQVIEQLRKDVQQLTKQTRDLETVNKKLMNELKSQNGNKKPLVPLKITRSVGLQVRLGNPSENLAKRRQALQSGGGASPIGSPVPTVGKPVAKSTGGRPRPVTPATGGTSLLQGQMPPMMTVLRQPSPQKQPPALVAATNPLLSQALTTNGPRRAAPVTAPQKRPGPPRASPTAGGAPPQAQRSSGAGVIDLTDEDERSRPRGAAGAAGRGKVVQGKVLSGKSPATGSAATRTVNTPTRAVTGLPQNVRLTTNQVKNGSIAIPSISSAGTQLMYVPLSTITSTAGPNGQKTVFLNLQPTNGVLANAIGGQMSVVQGKQGGMALKPASRKHPAPLPCPPRMALDPSLKPVPPKPHLTIRKTDKGIILQWKMPYNLDLFESIYSYQLYAYQETNQLPSTDMWRKVGDVKALALPMACTLTQFADKNKYYFAVRSVDVHKRIGAFSDPEEISL